jgi:hypothetical protein
MSRCNAGNRSARRRPSSRRTAGRSTKLPRNGGRRPHESLGAFGRWPRRKHSFGLDTLMWKGCAEHWPTGRGNSGNDNKADVRPPLRHTWPTFAHAGPAGGIGGHCKRGCEGVTNAEFNMTFLNPGLLHTKARGEDNLYRCSWRPPCGNGSGAASASDNFGRTSWCGAADRYHRMGAGTKRSFLFRRIDSARSTQLYPVTEDFRNTGTISEYALESTNLMAATSNR